MSSTGSFPRTRGLLDADNAKGWIFLGVFAFLVAGGWTVWLTVSQVTLVEVSQRAHLESVAYVHSVESVTAGLIVDAPARLGQWVEAGDLLLALETEHQDHALEEARGQLAAWRERLEASSAALEGKQQVADRDRELTERQLEEVEAKRAVELVTLDYAERRAERSEKLFELGLVSEVDLLHHQGDAEKADAEARVRRAEYQALDAKARRDAAKQTTELAEIELDIGEARGEIAALEARIDLLHHEIEDRRVRAPVAGRVGWLAPLHIGAVAEVGDRIAEIVPDDELRVIGLFPRSSIGRLELGQSAELRLDALPWTRFGTVALTVERLASEADRGRQGADGVPDEHRDAIRVELALAAPTDLPLAHGMTGTLEVAVEDVSPAEWLLRQVGRTAQRIDAPHKGQR